MPITLCPSQQFLLDQCLAAVPHGHVFYLDTRESMGKTTIFRELHARLGGAFLSMHELSDLLRMQHPLSLEETFEAWVSQALQHADRVFVDDLQQLADIVGGCSQYPRSGLLEVTLAALVDQAIRADKKLIFSTTYNTPGVLRRRATGITRYDELTVDDYAFFGRLHLGEDKAAGIAFDRIHHFAPSLNVRDLCRVTRELALCETLDTHGFIEYLRLHHLASNVALEEVQKVELRDLQGIADVVESLEANVVFPLENDEMAERFGLKPKRGVLLLGPPGTGKTTVGRALAHRLRGKFFLIDGTLISGTQNFYYHVKHIFEEAKHNAPAVIFIDDSDVIFESGSELGLYRYLLTMLDGLESAKAGRVCVMLTAMSVTNLPPALLRSGRVELWLEMQLPDAAARLAILNRNLSPLPEELAGLDFDTLVAQSNGFTGADLKRLAEDGKNLFAYDLARQRPLREVTAYFLDAIQALRHNKERYLTADAQARAQRPQRPVYFDVRDD